VSADSTGLLERRDDAARAWRDQVGAWLEIHPRALGSVPRVQAETLTLLLDTARHAGARAGELHRDLHHLRQLNTTLGALARQDSLTGLANRRSVYEVLEAECSRSRRHGRPLAVLVADVDGLKQVNDSHGHAAGDALLRAVADRMAGAVRAGDAVGRLSGDEFVVICPETSPEAARRVADKLLAEVAGRPVGWGEKDLTASVSIGWAALADHAGASELIDAADRALYRAKAAGRGRVTG
jgi:diguanylate cyclase (GGDEF)-like protein